MSAIDDIRAAIAAVIAQVSGAGQVHAFEPYGKGNEAFHRAYASADGKLLGWHVRRVATKETRPDLARVVTTHRWRVRVFMALAEGGASELEFDRLIEAVRDAFRADETLGGVVFDTRTPEVAGLQVDESLPVLFAGVLCHSANCTLYTVSIA